MRGSAQRTSLFSTRPIRAFAARWLALLLPLTGALGLAGCDGYTYQGSVVAMTLFFPPPAAVMPQPINEALHLEMWARLQTDSGPEIRRLYANTGSSSTPETFTGFTIVPAVDPNDTCLIRGLDRDDDLCGDPAKAPPEICGAQMFSQKAQIVPENSTPQLAQLGLVLQARKVTSALTPFRAYDPTVTGRAPLPLLALVQYNPDWRNDPRKRLTPIDATNAQDDTHSLTRLTFCLDYRDHFSDPGLANPNFYVGNPRQYTKPLAGTQFGFFTFSTSSATTPDLPNQNFSGISFSVPFAMDSISDLIVTAETTQNPAAPDMTRQLYVGTRVPDSMTGRGVVEMQMLLNTNPAFNPPAFTPSVMVGTSRVLIGTAAILTNLDQRLD